MPIHMCNKIFAWYLDDGKIVGTLNDTSRAIQMFVNNGPELWPPPTVAQIVDHQQRRRDQLAVLVLSVNKVQDVRRRPEDVRLPDRPRLVRARLHQGQDRQHPVDPRPHPVHQRPVD